MFGIIPVSSRVFTAEQVITNLKTLSRSASGKIDVKLNKVANEIRETAWKNAKKRSGNMANKTVVRKFNGNGGTGYEVVGTAPYTRSYHEGTGTHARYGKRPYIKEAFEAHKKEAITFTLGELMTGTAGNKGSFNSGWS